MLMDNVLKFLDDNKVDFTLLRHPAVVSVEDSKHTLHLGVMGWKSLFVKDKKSDRYFLAVLPADKRADMRALARYVNAEKFEFALPDKLLYYMGVSRGSVSPFCFLSPHSTSVTLLLDKQVYSCEKVRFHPCDNTATVIMKREDFFKCMALLNKKIIFVD